MKRIFKFLNKIKKVIGIIIITLGPPELKSGKRNQNNSTISNLSLNSTQHIERSIEKDKDIKMDCEICESSKSALKIRSGELSKNGPGARARADARRNSKAGKYTSSTIIIPGVSGYTPQHVYPLYHEEGGKFRKPLSRIEATAPNFNDEVPPSAPRIGPTVSSPNRQKRIQSKPLKINSVNL